MKRPIRDELWDDTFGNPDFVLRPKTKGGFIPGLHLTVGPQVMAPIWKNICFPMHIVLASLHNVCKDALSS